MNKPARKILFHPITKNRDKIPLLIHYTSQYFMQNHHLDILVDHKDAAQKIDEILWKYPKHSFLPHCLGFEETTLIRIYEKNHLQRPSLSCLNLTSLILGEDFSYQTIIEIEDKSSNEKQMLSKEKYHTYKTLGYQITSII